MFYEIIFSGQITSFPIFILSKTFYFADICLSLKHIKSKRQSNILSFALFLWLLNFSHFIDNSLFAL